MEWNIPNRLTVGRIALAAGFFVLLGAYQSGSRWGPWLLNMAFVVYLLAGLSDVLDGYLARKLNLVSAFGRIADPFVDKVLVVGAFVMLAGSNFTLSDGPDLRLPGWLTGGMASAVQAWMVVVILGREFIVSAVRGYSESCGVTFPATSAGKIKMFIQSVAICMVLVQLANWRGSAWAAGLKVALVWLATIVTLLSGLAYVRRAKGLMSRGGAGK